MKKWQSVVLVGLISLLLFGVTLGIATRTKETIEVNAMTGASRTKTRRALQFQEPWSVKTSWVAESAARQGIPTETGWKNLSVISNDFLARSRGCSRAPVAYGLGNIDPKLFGLGSTAAIDRFTREFVAASEERRKEMLVELP